MEKQLTKMNLKFALILFHVIMAFSLNSNKLLANTADGPKRIALKVNELKREHEFKSYDNVFSFLAESSDAEISKTVTVYTTLKVGVGVENILNTQPDFIRISVPSMNKKEDMILLLYKYDISPAGLQVLTSSEKKEEAKVRTVNYRGIIENNDFSVAAISFSENEIMGFVSNREGNFVLGKLKNDAQNRYIFYNDVNLIPQSNMTCSTNTNVPVNPNKNFNQNNVESVVKCVNFYYETDYDVYANKGSAANVVAYINGVFNQVSTLYANDGMTINLQTLFVWDAVDPYTGPNSGDYLQQFRLYRTTFAGDLAMLIGYNGGGGVAYLNGLCNTNNYNVSYSGIDPTFNNVPTYSWTIMVVAHEQGHLLSSQHTHDCVWNGNNTKIDACGDVAGYTSGSCPLTVPAQPTAGGTIMSYCHLVSAGINLAQGFGPQPAAQMINYINNSACIGICLNCVPPAPPVISGNLTPCKGSATTLSTGVYASYLWSNGATTNSITVTGAKTYVLSVKNIDGCSAYSSVQVINPASPTLLSTSSFVILCPPTVSVALSLSGTSTSFSWSPATGLNKTTGAAVVASPSVTTTYTVTGTSALGCTATTTIKVTVKPKPVNFTTVNITSTKAKTKWDSIPCAIGYNVQYKPAGGSWTTLSTAGNVSNLNITGLTPASNYSWRVRTKFPNGIFSSYTGSINFTTLPLRLGETATENVLQVYPNPATDNLTLEFPYKQGNANIIIINELGQTVISHDAVNINDAVELNIQSLSKGLYLVFVKNGDSTFSSRFIKK